MTRELAALKDEPWWESREKLNLIKSNICPSGIPDGEFAVAMEKCRRLDADPLSGEVFITKRNVNIGTRDEKKWVTKYEVQMAEAGMARRAERFPDFEGILGAVIYEGDDIQVDWANNKVTKHIGNPLKQVKVVAAWAQCLRRGHTFPPELVKLSEFDQGQGLWSKPAMMLWKVARATAYRRAFPEAFGGVYSVEELPPPAPKNEAPLDWPIGVEPLPEKELPSGSDYTLVGEKVVQTSGLTGPTNEAIDSIEAEVGAGKYIDEIRTLIMEEKLKPKDIFGWIRDNVPSAERYTVKKALEDNKP